jgi:hypothetical protein
MSTPEGIFVGGGSCFYWLHTHAADGIVHIESPVVRTFTLGNFFDVWGQELGPDRVGPASGRVTAIYNGRVFEGNPRQIPLTAHAQIQLEVGRPLVAPLRSPFRPGFSSGPDGLGEHAGPTATFRKVWCLEASTRVKCLRRRVVEPGIRLR